MDPIETLMAEHRIIERVLLALESYAGLMHSGEVTDRAELGRFVEFLRGFADKIHHGKEEELLFARMTEYGFPVEAGPLAVMLHEHESGRWLVRTLKAQSEAPGAWTPGDRATAAEAACEFAELLRAHIGKEDRILYPMAEQHLPAAVMQGLERDFGSADAKDAEECRRLVALADDLEKRWVDGHRISPLQCEPVPACGGCGGMHTLASRPWE